MQTTVLPYPLIRLMSFFELVAEPATSENAPMVFVIRVSAVLLCSRVY